MARESAEVERAAAAAIAARRSCSFQPLRPPAPNHRRMGPNWLEVMTSCNVIAGDHDARNGLVLLYRLKSGKLRARVYKGLMLMSTGQRHKNIAVNSAAISSQNICVFLFPRMFHNSAEVVKECIICLIFYSIICINASCNRSHKRLCVNLGHIASGDAPMVRSF